LYYSPGSISHLTRKADDGRLTNWPIVEDTLTPIPAQFRLRPVEQIKAAYKAANLEPPEIEPTGSDEAPNGDDAGASCEDACAEVRTKARAILLEISIEEQQ